MLNIWFILKFDLFFRVYVDNCCEINEPETRLATSGLDLVALDMRLHGATVHETIDRDVSHVVVDKR